MMCEMVNSRKIEGKTSNHSQFKDISKTTKRYEQLIKEHGLNYVNKD